MLAMRLATARRSSTLYVCGGLAYPRSLCANRRPKLQLCNARGALFTTTSFGAWPHAARERACNNPRCRPRFTSRV